MMKQNRLFKTLFTLAVMLFASSVMNAQNAEPYFVFNNDCTILSFYYDEKKEES